MWPCRAKSSRLWCDVDFANGTLHVERESCAGYACRTSPLSGWWRTMGNAATTGKIDSNRLFNGEPHCARKSALGCLPSQLRVQPVEVLGVRGVFWTPVDTAVRTDVASKLHVGREPRKGLHVARHSEGDDRARLLRAHQGRDDAGRSVRRFRDARGRLPRSRPDGCGSVPR
jgi:hypothetical protein